MNPSQATPLVRAAVQLGGSLPVMLSQHRQVARHLRKHPRAHVVIVHSVNNEFGSFTSVWPHPDSSFTKLSDEVMESLSALTRSRNARIETGGLFIHQGQVSIEWPEV